MSSVGRASAPGICRRGVCGLGLACLVALAGCSPDVTRFDFLGGTAPSVPGYGGSRPVQSRSGDGVSALQETTLAPVRPAPSQDYRVVGRSYPDRRAPGAEGRATWAAKPHGGAPASTWGNDSAPAWRDLQPVVRGERQALPRPPVPQTWRNDPPPWTDAQPFPWSGGAGVRQGTASPAPPASAFQGHYTVKRKDTLAGIAKRYRVSLDELKRVNGIAASAATVSAGTVLAIPVRSTAVASAGPPRVVQAPHAIGAPPPRPAPRPALDAEAAPKTAAPQPQDDRPQQQQQRAASEARPTRLSAAAPVRAAAPQKQDDTAVAEVAAAAGGKFRWPARGKVITGFGPQPDGSKSEGINLSLPMGTDIHAAEAGRVHYVGDGLKGYGNLILIRHPNGWVSAYAHADKMHVKVGEEVRRGQVIGKVGRSGPVAHPQLRFELRKGSVPVNPLPYLAN